MMISVYVFFLGILVNLLIVLMGKQVKLLAYIHLLYIWLIAVFSYNVVDYSNYSVSFQYYSLGGRIRNLELLYIGLIKLAYRFGFDFQIFRGILITVAMLLLVLSINHLKASINFVVVFFSLYPLFIDLIQIRTFLAMSILTFGLVFFLLEEKKLPYLLTVIMASLVHSSFLIYLMFVFNKLALSNKAKRNVLIAIAITSAFAFHFSDIGGSIVNTIIGLTSEDSRMQVWFSSRARFGFLYYWLLIIIQIVISITIERKAIIKKDFAAFLSRINIMMLFTLPLYTLASTFGRLVSNLALINYCGWQCTQFDGVGRSKSWGRISLYQVWVYSLAIVYVAVWIYLEIYSEFDNRVLPFFENNYFLDLLR